MGSSANLLRARGDLIAVIETAYAPARDDEEWARRVIDVAERLLPSSNSAAFYVFEPDYEAHTARTPTALSVGAPSTLPTDLATFLPNARVAEVLDAFFHPPALATTHREIARRLSPAAARALRETQEKHGIREVLGLVGHPAPGRVITFAFGLDRARTLTRHERRVLGQLTLHLETAFRLRHRPESVRAVIAPNGKLLARDGAPLDAEALAACVAGIERSRVRDTRSEGDALDLWSALVGGDLGVVERTEAGRRHYVVVENEPSRRSHHALTRREVEVVRMAARGVPSKLVAYGLGISPAAASNALASAAAKLGLASRLAVVRVASVLAGAPLDVDTKGFTRAESEIFALVQKGLSNDEIAQVRGRSVATVANQVAALLRKTQSPTRRSLVASLTEGCAASGSTSPSR